MQIQRLPRFSVKAQNGIEIDCEGGVPILLALQVITLCQKRFGTVTPGPAVARRIKTYIQTYLRGEMEAQRLLHLGGAKYRWLHTEKTETCN